MTLDQALKLVREAGYRVSKPKPKKQNRVGPTCVVKFADGEICRMTTHTSDDNPDFERGIEICKTAWYARKRAPLGKRLGQLNKIRKLSPTQKKEYENVLEVWSMSYSPIYPAIKSAHFERDGVIIATAS